jgi:hypothetical protein
MSVGKSGSGPPRRVSFGPMRHPRPIPFPGGPGWRSSSIFPRAPCPRKSDRTVRVQVSPDHDDWTYKPGAPVSFRIQVIRDGNPLPGASVSYSYGLGDAAAEGREDGAGAEGRLVVAAGNDERAGFPAPRGDGRGRRQEVPRARHRGLLPGSDQAHGRGSPTSTLSERGQGKRSQAADRRQAASAARSFHPEGRRLPGEPPGTWARTARARAALRHPGRAQRRACFPR